MKLLKLMIACCLLLQLVACSQSNEETNKQNNENKQEVVEKEDIVKLIENDKYISPLKPTKAQIEAYNQLSEAIEKEDSKKEAEYVAISFIYDFFTLKNKKDRDDVGGLQFIPSDMIGSFYQFAQSYYYGNYPVIVNTYGKDSLPEVVSVEVTSMEEVELEYNYSYCSGYELNVNVTYEKSKVDSLKTTMKIQIMKIRDFQYDRELDYVNDFITYEEEMKEYYRVLSLN